MIAGVGTTIALERPRRATRLLTGIAGGLLLGGLVIALGGGLIVVAVALAACGGVLGLCALAPGALAAVRAHRGWLVVAVALAIVAWQGELVAHRLVRGYVLARSVPYMVGPVPVQRVTRGIPVLEVAVLLLALGGVVLVSDAVRVWLGLAPRQRAPWRQMTEVRDDPRGIVWRGLTGAALTALAAVLAVGLIEPDASGDPTLQVVMVMAVAGAALLVVGTPLAVGALMRVDRDKAGTARELERQRFAAHLHDSVLQTLALVQRQAHDPVTVARLARRQEHALRAWMAGETELRSETLVAALRDVVAEVEDERSLVIELTAIGDRGLDRAGQALVAAAREALRNAARHANGAPVYVFAEMSTENVEVFVRDEGPGFDAAAVPAERRGIRDAIIGRMAAAGGTATVESAPGEGSEVTLRIPTRPGVR